MSWKKLKPPKKYRKFTKPKWAKDVQESVSNEFAKLGIDINTLDDSFNNKVNDLAAAYKNEKGASGDYDDCVTVVAAGAAAAGAAYGGPLGAALGAGAGVPSARIACRRIFPE
ncbi:hypothetical protein [Paenibacillus sp. Leaf72]|uniref:hypothetical protein n=1 Tax=Paenibacillus sp. Leaf72 TaxID=1736234 RepID=UPI0006F4A033|nr:hypothetical protein [Paenibacillus sp. Leaf72]KQN96793.1 hypothetical protein ASF12_22230 [Paenibacillus sp. Leaf72]